MTSHAYLDIHILHTVPPANLNRDDQGNPKEAIFGGVRRARVSSQAWKRATRLAFTNAIPGDRAVRSKKISSMLAARIAIRTGLDVEQATRLATALLHPLGIKAGKKAAETAYLLFFGVRQLDALVDLVAEDATALAGLDDARLTEVVKGLPVSEKLRTGHPLDVALFGRMVADLPSLNVDAATQVAHALSTHEAELEFDYYTAVDDETQADEPGAGMIGAIGFNSATLYRYATIGLHQLRDNLGGDATATANAVRLFIDAFARSVPSGHQNSFAHRTLPSLVVFALREDQPVNLVSAFERPVNSPGGIIPASIVALAKEFQNASEQCGSTPTVVAGTYVPVCEQDRETVTAAFGPSLTFQDVLSQARECVSEWLAGHHEWLVGHRA